MMLVPFLPCSIKEGWSRDLDILEITHKTPGVRPGWTGCTTKTRGRSKNKHILGTLGLSSGATELH